MHGSPFSIEVFANAPAGLLDAMAIYSTYQKPSEFIVMLSFSKLHSESGSLIFI